MTTGNGIFRWYWANDFDTEAGYYGGFATRQEAIDNAMQKRAVGEQFVILEADKRVPDYRILSGPFTIETFEENNLELWSEDGSGLMPENREEMESLEAHMAEAFRQWIEARPDPLNVWIFAIERNKEVHTVSAPPSGEFLKLAHAL